MRANLTGTRRAGLMGPRREGLTSPIIKTILVNLYHERKFSLPVVIGLVKPFVIVTANFLHLIYKLDI